MTSRKASGVALAVLLFASSVLPAPGASAGAEVPPGIDASYGTGGTATVPIPDQTIVRHRMVVLDSFGGQMVGSAGGNMAADPSIGDGTSLPGRSVFVPGTATDLVYSAGRGLLLAGISDADQPVVQRLGSLQAYGTGGVATVPVTVAAGDVHLDEAGAVVSGVRTTLSGSAVFVAQLDSDGRPVPSWGTNGVATVDLGAGDDTLVGVVGDFVVGISDGSLHVVRLTATGAPDAAFGTKGAISFALQPGTSYSTVSLGTSLLVGGVDGSGHGLVTRVAPSDGASSTITLDWLGTVQGFGANDSLAEAPLVTVTAGGVRFATVRLSDGVAVKPPVDVDSPGVEAVHGVVGDAAWLLFDQAAEFVAVDRATNPATVSTSHLVTSTWGATHGNLVASTAPRPDNSTIVLGHGTDGTWLTALRPDGSPDTDFGVVRPAMLGDPIAVRRLVDGRLLVITATGVETWLSRFAADGTLDASYGSGGVVQVPGAFDPDAIVVDPDGATTLVGDRARFVTAAGVWDSTYGDTHGSLVSGSERVVAARRTGAGGPIEYFVARNGPPARNVLDPTGGPVSDIPQIIENAAIGTASVPVVRADGSITWVAPATAGVPADQATSWRFDTVANAKVVRSSTVRTPFVGVLGNGLALSTGGLLMTVWSPTRGSAVVRFNADGSVDTAFGRGGVIAAAGTAAPVIGRGAGATVLVGMMSATLDATITRLRTDQPPAPVRSRYVALAAPARLVDTRSTGGAIAAGTSRVVQVTGRLGIPANAVAIATNATFLSGAGGGYGQLYGPGTQWPGLTGSVVLRPGGGAASAFTVSRIGTGGTIGLRTTRTAHAIVDVYGYWVPAQTATSGRWVAETSARRVLDTRLGLRIPAMGSRLVATGRPGATAVVVNLTVVSPAAAGSLRVMGGSSTTSSAMSYAAGETRATMAIVPVTANGSIRIASTASAHVVVDVIGYVTGATAPASGFGLFMAVSPSHVVDTRSGGRVPPGLTSLTIGGDHGIPTTARGALVSVVALNAAAPGAVSAERWSSAAAMIRLPAAGTPVSGSTAVPLVGGKLAVRTTVAAHLVVDVAGWFT